MANVLQVGVSALVANQSGLRTVGHNIANTSTEGYSRQQVNYVARTPTEIGQAGFLGNGVGQQGVQRVVDSFLAEELNSTANSYQRFEVLYTNASRLDDLLGDDSTGLSPTIRGFFEAIQSGAESPTSSASRQLMISQAELMVNRFHSLQERLNNQNDSINLQIETIVEQINAIARQIGELNEQIAARATNDEFSQPNDLLDQRDQLIFELSELVSVDSLEGDDRTTDIYIGNGQGLVIGNQVFGLETETSRDDASRLDINFVVQSSSFNITNNISGGELGGMLEFREEILDLVYNRMGIVAAGIMSEVNDQQQRGMDLDNEVGINFFNDLNSETLMRSRYTPDVDNALPDDRVIEVSIDELGELLPSDYSLEFTTTGNMQYTITRLSDDTVVASNILSGVFPSTTEFDGLEVNLVSGSFSDGDRFTLRPYRTLSGDIEIQLTNIRDIAFAQPIRTSLGNGNVGTGRITQGEVMDTSTASFDRVNNALVPPIMIEFLDETSYDVLDVTDPANPVNLVPPMLNQTFTRGLSNAVFTDDENETGLTTDGTDISVVQVATAGNGYSSETIEFTTVDPETQVISRQSVTTALDDTAETTAQALNALVGVTATGRNYAEISNILSASPMTLTFNGELLAGTDADTLRDSINNNLNLAADGISAKSDGSTISIRANTGVDFTFQVGGGTPGDSVTVTTEDGAVNTVTGAFATPAITFGGKIDIFMSEGVTVSGEGALVSVLPNPISTYRGYQVEVDGAPQEGDLFFVNYNTDGFSDNRNAVAMAQLQATKILDNGEATFNESYINLVNVIGTSTNELEISREATLSIFERARADRNDIAGVNMDEEAVKLLQFEQAYNAAAQIITIARSTFDTLIRSTGG